MDDRVKPPSNPPRLEFYPPNSPELHTVTLEAFPFTIGRVSETDLQLNSSSVSREHARLTIEAGRFVLRDLGSTNGTTVNGQPITEARLSDGDAIGVANIDLSFLVSSVGRLQRMVTQPLSDSRPTSKRPDPTSRLAERRRDTELLLWQAISFEAADVADRFTGEVAARVVSVVGGPGAASSRNAARVPWLAVQRFVNEAAVSSSDAAQYFRPADAGRDLDQLVDAFAAAAPRFDADRPVGVVIPASLAAAPRAASMIGELAALGVRFAWEVTSVDDPVADESSRTPDFLLLSPAVLRAASESPLTWDRFRATLADCQDRGARVVARDCDESLAAARDELSAILELRTPDSSTAAEPAAVGADSNPLVRPVHQL